MLLHTFRGAKNLHFKRKRTLNTILFSDLHIFEVIRDSKTIRIFVQLELQNDNPVQNTPKYLN